MRLGCRGMRVGRARGSRRPERAGRRGLAAALLAGIAAGVLAAGPAGAGAAFGVRAGYANIDTHAFTGAGKIGGTPLYGIQAVLPIVPLVSLVVAGEQRSKSFDFADVSVGDLRYRGRAKWTDQALYAGARVNLPGVVGLYGGGGVAVHRQKTDLSNVVEVTGRPFPGAAVAGPARAPRATADDPLTDFVHRTEKEFTDPSWNAFVGIEFGFPVVPVALFAEGRLEDIKGASPASGADYAGVNLSFRRPDMVAVVQRVSRAAVRVDGAVTGEIGRGLLVLLGVRAGDGEADAAWLASKVASLRIFPDGEGKMNRGLEEAGGGMLVVSQFTLLGDCVKGRRPSFTDAAPPAEANRLYECFCAQVRGLGLPVATGVFQAMMAVELVNEGPVTLIVDSAARHANRRGGEEA